MSKRILNLFIQYTLFTLCVFSTTYAQEWPDPSYDSWSCSPCEAEECWAHTDRYWFNADYIHWRMKSSPTPIPLIITSPTASPLPNLDSPNISVLLGEEDVKNRWRGGASFSLGYWFDDCYRYGVEANYFFLSGKSWKKTVRSSDVPDQVLALPFFNVQTLQEDSTGIALPSRYTGTATLRVFNRMHGLEFNGLLRSPYETTFNMSFLAGFRYWHFKENLDFSTDSPNIVPAGAPTEVYTTKDKFHVENDFYGVQVGATAEYGMRSGFFCNAKAKVAIGAIREELYIDGKFTTNDFNQLAESKSYNTGYFGLRSNHGTHKQYQFAVLPEGSVNIGYQFEDYLQVYFGYSFLYVNKLLTAGNQIDRHINPTQSHAISDTDKALLAGEKRPKPLMHDSSFWAQGFRAGIEYRF